MSRACKLTILFILASLVWACGGVPRLPSSAGLSRATTVRIPAARAARLAELGRAAANAASQLRRAIKIACDNLGGDRECVQLVRQFRATQAFADNALRQCRFLAAKHNLAAELFRRCRNHAHDNKRRVMVIRPQ